MSKCVYCGNNPVPHFSTWFNETFFVYFEPLTNFCVQSFLGRIITKILYTAHPGWIWLMAKARLVHFNSTPQQNTSNRAKVLWEEAVRRGWKMESVAMFGREIDYYRVAIGQKTLYFSGLPRPLTTPGGSDGWMDDKWRLKQTLLKKGISVAAGGNFARFAPLLECFNTLTKPVIIKPRLGSRGRHTTTFIFTVEELKKAFRIAKQLCHWVIMEEHLVGSVYRGTVIGGKLAGVLAGDPPRVTGDGIHTISELVAIKNAHKNPMIKNVQISPVTIEFLARSCRALTDILPTGLTIDLSEKIGVSYGGSAREVTTRTHPKIKTVLEQAAAALQDPILGFDFIIEHIDQDPDTQKWGIIECNSLPFINLHYDAVEGGDNNVAKNVWDYVEQNINDFV